MRVEAVDRESEKLAAALLQLRVDLGEGDELGRANRREIGRVREEDQPAALEVAQLELAVSCDGFEGGRRLVETRKRGADLWLLDCRHKSSSLLVASIGPRVKLSAPARR